jgi:U3 small nucleolar RNA-associated protein 6
MLPDLHNFLERKLFTREEIQAIVETRTNNEYKLIRKNLNKRHFLEAIRYEIALERKRDAKVAAGEHTKSDYSIVKRIAKLFDRAVAVFKHDVGLWKDYIDFCLRAKRNASLGKVIARAILLHPRSRDLWMIAFNVEKLVNTNWEGSRDVLQKAVKFLPTDREIWISYLSFERDYIARSEIEAVKSGAVLKIALKHALASTAFKHHAEDLAEFDEFINSIN